MKINKDDKVVDALYEENKMLREKMNKQKDILYSYIDDVRENIQKDRFKSGIDVPYIRGVVITLKNVKEFCERNIWN